MLFLLSKKVKNYDEKATMQRDLKWSVKVMGLVCVHRWILQNVMKEGETVSGGEAESW